MPTLDLALSATRSYQARLDRLANGSATAMARRWDALGSYDRADIGRWLEQIGPVVEASNAQATAMASGYLQVMLDDHRVASRAVIPADVDLEAPFLRMWHLLSTGDLWDQARLAGRTVAEFTGSDVVHRSARQATVGAADERVVGWRRVPDSKACEWCRTIAGQRYRTEESAAAPHHPGCGCTVVPIVGSADPGRILARS